jgi:hypothetical protein
MWRHQFTQSIESVLVGTSIGLIVLRALGDAASWLGLCNAIAVDSELMATGLVLAPTSALVSHILFELGLDCRLSRASQFKPL